MKATRKMFDCPIEDDYIMDILKPGTIYTDQAPYCTYPISDEIIEECTSDRIVLECPLCHQRTILQPHYANVAERFVYGGKRYIRFMAKSEQCEYLLTSSAHLDEWNENILKEEHL